MPIFDVDGRGRNHSHPCNDGADDAASCPGSTAQRIRRDAPFGRRRVRPAQPPCERQPLTLVRPLVEGFPSTLTAGGRTFHVRDAVGSDPLDIGAKHDSPAPYDLLGHRLTSGSGRARVSGFGGLHGGPALALFTWAIGSWSTTWASQRHSWSPGGDEAYEAAARHGGVSCPPPKRPPATATKCTSTRPGACGEPVTAPRRARSPLPPRPSPCLVHHCPVFTIPPEIVPFGQHVEVRPVGPARPAVHRRPNGRARRLAPTLVADDQPPDELRMITLIDALAPSYAAVMTAPGRVPTTEITVRPGVALRSASSPWVNEKRSPAARVPTAGSTPSTSTSGASMAPTWPRRCSSV